MGLRELKPENWIESGNDLEAQLLERREIIRNNRDQVVQVVDAHSQALEYFSQKILKNVATYHPDYVIHGLRVTHVPSNFSIDLADDNPFVQLAQVIAEDLCLLHYDNEVWKLVAGVVIYPSRWNLREKIGQTLDGIHTPVPGYSTELQPYMTQTFNKIHPNRPVWRKNWSLHASSLLHEPFIHHIDEIAENYWWRTERQTLTRSETSDYMLFTIRNRSEPLKWIKNDPDAALQFAHTLSTVPPAMLEYKNLVERRDELIAFLQN